MKDSGTWSRRGFLQALATFATVMLPAGGAARASPTGKLVIAHRGASGYLPEHTLAAKAMAHAMGADFLEQDVVLSRDEVAVVLHDITLEATTNVASVFPGRARDDGRYYAIDFDWAELRQLSVNERVNAEGAARYPLRFPADAPLFRLHTLAEELALVRGLNSSTGRVAGIYPELKAPRWHAAQGKDVGAVVGRVLAESGYGGGDAPVFVQSFDAAALKAFPETTGLDLPLVQLIGENRWWPEDPNDFDAMRTPAGLDAIAEYAAGIGPWFQQLVSGLEPGGSPASTGLAGEARTWGLVVHPYTLRADQLPEGIASFEQLLELLLVEEDVDGVFTDHPDRVRAWLDTLSN